MPTSKVYGNGIISSTNELTPRLAALLDENIKSYGLTWDEVEIEKNSIGGELWAICWVKHQ